MPCYATGYVNSYVFYMCMYVVHFWNLAKALSRLQYSFFQHVMFVYTDVSVVYGQQFIEGIGKGFLFLLLN